MSRKRAAASDAHESVTISGIQAWLSNWHRAGQRNRPRTNSDTLACHFCCTTLAPSVELFRITESLAGVLGGLEVPAPPTNHSDKTAGGLLETRMYEYRRRTTGYSDAVQHGQRPHVALQQTNHRRQHTTWEWPHRNPQARHGKFRGANPGGGAWDFGCSQTRVLAEKMAGEGNKHETPFLQGGYCDERRARPSERAQRRAGQGRAGHPAGTEYSIHAAAARQAGTPAMQQLQLGGWSLAGPRPLRPLDHPRSRHAGTRADSQRCCWRVGGTTEESDNYSNTLTTASLALRSSRSQGMQCDRGTDKRDNATYLFVLWLARQPRRVAAGGVRCRPSIRAPGPRTTTATATANNAL
ncbi:hypothetical protein ACCO45_011192 [Purpureocillium lilacinum]|uniref:Uncharacterized protein n=1 Tax=Purpureocillium lilacinum TaxID=33203 RepID=A0ACC4DIE4_PURLI